MPKILIADDSIAVRKVAERLLTEAGMGVTLAANGSEALALLGKDRPDLIVSDVIMPDKSGYEVCAFIRAQANLADIPVLLISGIVNDEVSRQAESCKADGVLKKPFQGTSLKDRVLDLLTKRQTKPVENSARSPVTSQSCAEISLAEKPPATTILKASEEPQHHMAEPDEHRQSNGTGTIGLPQPEATPVTESSHEVTALMAGKVSDEPAFREQGDDSHVAILAQRDARISELEAQLASERRESQEQMQCRLEQQHAQLAELSSRVQALDAALSEERTQRATLTEQLEEVSRQAHRAGALETELVEARRHVEELSRQVSDNARNESRILELEAHLAAERGAAAQLVQQITTLEHMERRAHELEMTLASERAQAEADRKQSAHAEVLAGQIRDLEDALAVERARVAELTGTLATERETAALLMTQVKQLEAASRRAHELDLALASEGERSMQLMKRATDAEYAAEQSNRRFEDMARKLGEIAGLASQLGNAKR